MKLTNKKTRKSIQKLDKKKPRLHHAPLLFFTENTTHQTTYLMVMHTFMRVSHDKIEERNLSTPMHPFPIYSYHQESLKSLFGKKKTCFQQILRIVFKNEECVLYWIGRLFRKITIFIKVYVVFVF